ncbi:MAG: RecQ family ATP-dependent DNA helicase [Colwellia sp.]|nr:RecQ family ATP-dependent DNA helicase [Colwellia sp.]
MKNPLTASLIDYFGFDSFRQGQEQTVTQLLSGQSSLSIFPTGSGKSLCYQLTALHLPHLTLVVSPLLALMKDQLTFLASKNIAAASIDSTLKGNQVQQVMTDIRNGKTKILMVSVERFKNERFRQFIQSVAVSMLVVDEAHCISEWGHNFRPDYLKLPNYRHELKIPLVLLLTATATKQVKLDMAAKFSIAEENIVQTGFYRSNLDLSVVPVTSENKNKSLLSAVEQQQGAGIIYVTLQKSAEHVAHFLVTNGINAKPYHAGFDSDKRQNIQENFMHGKVQIIVATIAFGMGIDKADIRFVIHYDLPKSIENYSQEIGRAGRDGGPSKCITLANLDGLNTVENFVYGDTPELSGIEVVLNNIATESYAAVYAHQGEKRWEIQGLQLVNASNIRQLPLKTLLVQLELYGVIEPLHAYFADFKIKLLKPKEEILAGFNQDRQAFITTIFSHISFKKVWGSLSFDSLLASGEIDRNRVVSALEYLHEQQLIVLETKGMTEVFKVNNTELSKPLLASNLHQYFIDKEKKEIKRIAALIAFFELDSCLTANLSEYFDDHSFEKLVQDTEGKVCGHCSVCRGEVAKLNYSFEPQWPSDQQLLMVLTPFIEQLSIKIRSPISVDTCCRFLSGMSLPIFARNKVRQMTGFALCEQLPYADIRQKVKLLINQA